MTALDAVQLNFNPTAVLILNGLLAMIVFGVALDLSLQDFIRLRRQPRAILTGLCAQCLLLPALTALLIVGLSPSPSLALGMILIAACPGGSVSNFFSQLARADVALSVSLSAISSLCCFLMTPFTIAFWAGLLPTTQAVLQSVEIDFVQMLLLVAIVLIIPTALGVLFAYARPGQAAALKRPLRLFSMTAFILFVVLAFFANGALFIDHANAIFWWVLVHNSAAFALGFALAWLTRCRPSAQRSICIEVGIQNTALGLALALTFFPLLGSVALITAWWGVWHLIAGGAIAWFWSSKAPEG
ncbi:MAG: bile acid:sodium symporter [Pseudomonadota bacterium]